MQLIELTRHQFAIVDNADYPKLAKFKWCAKKIGKTFYAARGVGPASNHRTELMHRRIMGFPKGLVDHRNGHGLDNRRQNLRLATHSQNAMNFPKRRTGGTSKHRGVHWCSRQRRWVARLTADGTHLYLGSFKSEKAAARARWHAENTIFGDYAVKR